MTKIFRLRWHNFYFVSFLIAETLFAGAWTQRKDHYSFRLSGFSFHSRAIFDKNGNRVDLTDNGRFTDIGAYAYLEYGLSDVVIFVGSVPYKRLRFRNESSAMPLNRKTSAGAMFISVCVICFPIKVRSLRCKRLSR